MPVLEKHRAPRKTSPAARQGGCPVARRAAAPTRPVAVGAAAQAPQRRRTSGPTGGGLLDELLQPGEQVEADVDLLLAELVESAVAR